jgi:DNA invertase Pin-like site-specific DNA recombinase
VATDVEGEGGRRNAALYLRMSTEQQVYSLANQAQAMLAYAEAHAMDVVTIYADEGRSGLTLRGRSSLKRLLNEVQAGGCAFTVLLVYDVSRWGRFQDVDESAFHEHTCFRAGIEVVYCFEPFNNDQSALSSIMKDLKRVMAGEYSRDLSAKVSAAQCRLAALGYHQGGPVGYGLRRVVVDDRGTVKGPLRKGEAKTRLEDHVAVVPGPRQELAVVRRIFSDFVSSALSISEITRRLNADPALGEEWSFYRVKHVLQNEAYIGHVVFGRRTTTMRNPVKHIPSHLWVRYTSAFPPIVPDALFSAAAERLKRPRRRPLFRSDEAMLQSLRDLYAANGRISARMIDATAGMSNRGAYRARFGGVLRAAEMAGIPIAHDYGYLEKNAAGRSARSDVMDTLVATFSRQVSDVHRGGPRGHIVHIGHNLAFLVRFVRGIRKKGRGIRWNFAVPCPTRADYCLLVRQGDEDAILDYYLFPAICLGFSQVVLGPENAPSTDRYRVRSLADVLSLALKCEAHLEEMGPRVGRRLGSRERVAQDIGPAADFGSSGEAVR